METENGYYFLSDLTSKIYHQCKCLQQKCVKAKGPDFHLMQIKVHTSKSVKVHQSDLTKGMAIAWKYSESFCEMLQYGNRKSK